MSRPPVIKLSLLGGHCRQRLLPGAGLYEAVAHRVHTVASRPPKPLSHMHCAKDAAPGAAVLLLAGHWMQLAAPTDGMYDPTSHAAPCGERTHKTGRAREPLTASTPSLGSWARIPEQGPPLGPEKPGTHRH